MVSGQVYPGYGYPMGWALAMYPRPWVSITLNINQNVPSFLIDQVSDEVSQTGIAVLLDLGPVLLNYGPVSYPYQANTTVEHGQNSVKQGQTVPNRASPLQKDNELHQKDLRINLI